MCWPPWWSWFPAAGEQLRVVSQREYKSDRHTLLMLLTAVRGKCLRKCRVQHFIMLQLLIRADSHFVDKNPVQTLLVSVSRSLEPAVEKVTGALMRLTCISEIFSLSLVQGPSCLRFFVVLRSFKLIISKQTTTSYFVSYSLKFYSGST
jgi:hypothetical protein